MKKTLAVLLVALFLIGVLGACAERSESEEAIPPSEAESPVPLSAGVTSANVQVHLATDELLSQFDSYHEFYDPDEMGSQRIVITSDKPLQSFSFAELRSAEHWPDTERDGIEPYEMWHLYSLEMLTPEMPFVVNWMHRDFTTHRGISFWSEGFPYDVHFAIYQSGYDGQPVLMEIENRLPSSPRTAVTGILADPAREWTEISASLWSDPETHQWFGEEGPTHTLNTEDANQVFEILSTMEATEIPTPFHYERQSSNAVFVLEITYADNSTETILTTEMGIWFFRLTNTFGDHGDPGFVIGISEALFEILSAYFPDGWTRIAAEYLDDSWDDETFVIRESVPEQFRGAWNNDMGETYVISHEIPQGESWIMTRLPNGSYRILVENDSPAHYEKWFFPVGAEMIRYGTNWSLVSSDTSRARLFVGTFSITTCCPDEEIYREVFYRTAE